MTAKQSMLDLLKQEKQRKEGANPSDTQKEWLRALRELMDRLCKWMQEAVSDKLLQVEKIDQALTEERIGRYHAPALKIVTPAGVSLTITPKARFIVGAGGRVDLECPPKKAILVRKASADWQFAEIQPGRADWRFKDLTEESYWQTLRELLS